MSSNILLSSANGRMAFFRTSVIGVRASRISILYTAVNVDETVIIPVKGNSSGDLGGTILIRLLVQRCQSTSYTVLLVRSYNNNNIIIMTHELGYRLLIKIIIIMIY